MNWPIDCTPKGVRLCRPGETVLDLIDKWPAWPLYSEDGSLLGDSEGRRVR